MKLSIDARTAAFGGLIDYAGVFPPASLAMRDAVRTYRTARSGSHRWVLGRFLCPASRLEDLAAVAMSEVQPGDPPWGVGVIVDLPHGSSVAHATAFHREMAPALAVTAAEARPTGDEVHTKGPGALIDALAAIDKDTVIFIEVDSSSRMVEQLAVISTTLRGRGRSGGAKLRCGGATPDMFPSPEVVASFIAGARDLSLPFKATAGLHEPIRHHDDQLDVWRHGFVNILVASAAASGGADLDTITDIVAESDASTFTISPMLASWRDARFPGSAIARARKTGFVGYGSCDLNEPLDGLIELGFLGEGS